MPKKIRRSVRNAGAATANFVKWLPKATEHFFGEVPKSANSLRAWVVTFKGGLTMILLAFLFLFPLISQNPWLLGIFIYANILVIYAASWDLLAGFAGQVSFGHAVPLGIAAYVTSALVSYSGQPWWLSLFGGALAAVIVGLFIAVPSLRLRGPYFALGTLAFALILIELFRSATLEPWLGGSEGISKVPPLSADPAIEYLVVLVAMLLSLVIMITVVKSRVGTVFKSIRDDEVSAEASGINTTKYKLVAFMISAFFAGIAGGFFALHYRGVSPEIYSTLYSFYAIVMASLGGIGTIFGSVGGAYFFSFLSEFLRGFAEFAVLAFAILLVVILRFASGGFIKPLVERLREFIDILRGK